MTAGFALFLGLLFGLLALANRFVHRRAAQAFDLKQKARRLLAASQGFALVALFLGRALKTALPVRAAATIAAVGWLVELAVVLGAALLLLVRAAELLASIRRKPAPVAANGAAVSRRDALATGAAIAAGAAATAYGWLDRRSFELEQVPIHLAKLPRALDGFTIAQLSDLHLGLFVGEREMRRAVELVRRAKPDLIAITGDMLDADELPAELLGRLVRTLGDIAPVAAVPGNHDYYAGIGASLGAVRRAGGQVLLNRSLRTAGGRIAVSGVDDLWARRHGGGPDLAAALAGVPEDLPRVLLAHQPVVFEQAAAHVDVQLSGHTHGGQLNPGFQPLALVLPHGWIAGRYTRGQAQLYVNRGFGTAGPPARLGSPPEVTRVVLTCA